MGEFTRKSAIGLTWTPDGRCWGVHLRKKRDGCAIALFWQGAATDSESLATRLAEGFRYLGHRENAAVVVGGCGWQSAFADVDMPKLPADELRSALSFELSKRSPLATDKIVWGYRILADLDAQHQKVRLVYMRESEWARWIDDVSGLEQGIDVLIPPPAVLDPLLKDQTVFFPENDGGNRGFLFQPDASGGRTIARGRCENPAFGAGAQPLDLPQLSLGGLEAKSAETKQRFMPAILLAMYGLTHAVNSDKRTLLPIPYELRPKRHRYSSMVATVLIAYLIVLSALGLGREFRAANVYYRDLVSATAAVQSQITELSTRQDTSAFMQQLTAELEDAKVERPSMAAALLELTRIIGTDAWVTRFEWIDGSVNVTLNMQEEDLDLIRALEASPVLGDVVPGNRRVSADQITLALQMNARYETEAERLASQPLKFVEDDDVIKPLPPTDEAADLDEQDGAEYEETGATETGDGTAAEIEADTLPPLPALPELPEPNEE